MDASFSNDEVRLDDLPKFETVEFHPVEAKLQTKSLFIAGVFSLLTAIGLVLNILLNDSEISLNIILGIVLGFLVILITDIVIRQKFYGYSIREKDIIFRKGYIFQKTTVVPYNRIQHLSVNRSFFDKMFGISSLYIYTAGGNSSDIHIPGLLPDIADSINELLSKKVSEND